MTWTIGRQKNVKSQRICKCDHPNLAHYTKEGSCVFGGCGCKEYRPKGRLEYQNKRARCEYGHHHDSGTETKACFDFHCQLLANEIKSYTGHQNLELIGPSGAVIGHYAIDFVVTHLDDSIEFIECKGRHLQNDGSWRLKWALLQDKYKGYKDYKFRVILD